jgi:translocation and assembly module TamB
MAAAEPPTATPPPTPPAPAPRRRRRFVLRWLATATASLLLVVALLAAAIGWLVGTTGGLDSIASLVARFAPVKVETRGAFGALAEEFGFAALKITVGDTTVEATEVRARLRGWGWQPPRIDFEDLQAASLLVRVIGNDKPPPTDIGVPLAISAERARLGRLTVAVDDSEFSLQSIEGRAFAGPAGYRVEGGRVAFGPHTARVDAELGGRWPYALHAHGEVSAQLRERTIDAAVRAAGSLLEMTVDGTLSGAARGTLSAVVASFDKPAVRTLSLDLAGVDPRFWHPAAPSAELFVKAELAPNSAMDRVAGTIAVQNRAPGLIDAGRIPARSASAQVELDAIQLRFSQVVGQLAQGSVRGDFAVAFADGSWQTGARLSDVDPARLHGALQSMRVDGQVQARRTPQAIFVDADLSTRGEPAAALTFSGSFTSALARIDSARLVLGDGYATAAGSIELAGAHRADLKGALHRFEPGRLLKGVDARLTGNIAVDGVLKPRPAGRLRFELADSRAWGRPLSAHGRVDVDAQQRLDVDVDLAVRTARLVAKGGLGAPERSLEVKLDVPAIAELLPPSPKVAVAGAIELSATARGEWTAPEVQSQWAARGLRYGDHALASLSAQASYGGGSDGTLRVSVGAAGYSFAPRPGTTVEALSLVVDGHLSNHAIRLQATADRTQSASIIADGGWRDGAWRGRVREAVAGPPFDLRLLVPAALTIGPSAMHFGPAQIAVQHVRFDDVDLRIDESGAATQGRFSGLQPQRLSVPVQGGLTPVLAPTGQRPPLTLRGEWDLRLASGLVDGRLRIERSDGDLYAGRGPRSALGLTDAWLEARIAANQLSAAMRIEGTNSGGIGAHLDAWLEDSDESGWRLAQARPWLINGAFDLQGLNWINALLSEHLRASVRLRGNLAGTVRVEGTPRSPVASGRLVGSDLRVSWIEQGVRLENGRLLAHLQDDLIVLDELHFSGPPVVQPDDRRAAAAVPPDREGSVTANGRLRLGDLSGVIQVAATHLPLLQRPDRWVIASGGGNIEMSAKRVQVNGAFAAEAGFVGIARAELPSLSDDVVVVSSDQAVEGRERRVALGFDLGIDLGKAFFLSGKGLSTRVEGAVRLRSAGRGAVTAVGTIEAVDGVYEGFGQRLQIARGRLNFQGAPENPGLDILALRTGLPVEVGVTITRTAAAPLVRIHSDPPMPDAEALSWLVLGRAPDQAGGDNIALAAAAAGLLGGSSEGYPTRVARAIGVDEISIRSGNFGIASLLPARGVAGSLRSEDASGATVAGEIITIGKNINDALTLSYQQAISDTTRFLQLNYRLSQRLSVVARGGTDNALDLVYSFAFD